MTEDRDTPLSETVLYGFRVYVCNQCLAGRGAECWTPGCMFWCDDVPADEIASRLLLAFTADDGATKCEVAS